MSNRCALLVAAFVLLCTSAWAQPQSASIRGVVENETGAVLAGATVVLSHPDGALKETRTDQQGRFAFNSVARGEFVLIVEADQYQTAEQRIVVGPEPVAELRVRMRVNATESVSVSARAQSRVAAERNADALTMSTQFASQLPIDGQEIVPFLQNMFSPAAQGAGDVSVVVDGAETDALDLPSAAISRIVVNRNPYGAEFRRPGKTRLEIVTERGGFLHAHGGVALFLRNARLDARNPFSNTNSTGDRELVTMNLEGPLGVRRRAFFVTAEILNAQKMQVVNARTLAGPVIADVPTPENRVKFSARLDQRLRGARILTGRYDYFSESNRNRGAGGLNLPEHVARTDQLHHRAQLADRAVIGTSMTNELRGAVAWERLGIGDATDKPAVVVHGAFVGGPSQAFRSDRTTQVELQNASTYFRGRHQIKFGGQWRTRVIRVADRSNFGGTFEFPGLDAFARNMPSVFRVNRGDPNVALTLHDGEVFIQDEFTPTPRVNVLFGGRYDRQSGRNSSGDFAPRAAFSIAPTGGRVIVRGGAGMFSERLPSSAFERSALYDGVRLQSLVLANPAFPVALGAQQLAASKPSVVLIAPDIRTPRLLQASVGMELPVSRRSQLTVDVQMLRGWHLLRSRDINAPGAGSLRRPNPDFTNVNQVESSAVMRGQALSVNFASRLPNNRFRGNVQYTLSRTTNNTDRIFSLPADNHDLAAEMGRADFDRRHHLNFMGTAELPGRVRVGTVLTIKSRAPLDIMTGRDTNGDTVANDRPAGVSRNTGQGPGFGQLDVRVTKLFRAPRPLSSRDRTPDNFGITLDVFNVLNRANADKFVNVQSSPFFGRAVVVRDPRTMQLSIQYRF
jgi:hypothetical protein